MSAAKRKADTRTPVYCQRCGCEIPNATNSQKWCPYCKMAVKAQQSRQSYLRRHEAAPATNVESEQRAASHERKKSARTFAGPYMTNPRPADVATRAAAKAQVGEDRLRLLSNVADWAGISYGQLMLKSPAAREALILGYKSAKGGKP